MKSTHDVDAKPLAKVRVRVRVRVRVGVRVRVRVRVRERAKLPVVVEVQSCQSSHRNHRPLPVEAVGVHIAPSQPSPLAPTLVDPLAPHKP